MIMESIRSSDRAETIHMWNAVVRTAGVDSIWTAYLSRHRSDPLTLEREPRLMECYFVIDVIHYVA